MIVQDIQTLKKTLSLVRDCSLWPGYHNIGDIYIGSKRSKSDYLNVFRTVCCLANIVYKWFNWRKVQMVRWACWYPLSSTDPNNIGQIGKKLPAMYNCVKCMCVCVIVGFDFIGKCWFWNIGTMFSQRGEVCNLVATFAGTSLGANLDLSNCRLPYRIKYQELCSSQALELVVLADKYHTRVTS